MAKGGQFSRNLQLEYNEENKSENAYLVVSQKLLNDYFGGTGHTQNKNAIASIFDKMDFQDRVIRKSKAEIDSFFNKYFDKKTWRAIRCKRRDSNDHFHIAIICLSDRQLAITLDNDLTIDLRENLPRMKGINNHIRVGKCPSEIPYK